MTHSHAASMLADFFFQVRERTRQLAAPLSDEDCCAQSMPDASPVKWHLAHTSWFFETFVLERFEARFTPFDPAYRVLFNSYYNGIGTRHPRHQRGLLTRPALSAILRYRQNIDQRIATLLGDSRCHNECLDLVILGLHHEQQHQELILTDIKHLLSLNPLKPGYRSHETEHMEGGEPIESEWVCFAGGMQRLGYAGAGFCFDNERPQHTVYLQPYELASRLVTNGEYLAFVQDGGYVNPAWWLADGWDWLQTHAITHPLYWSPVAEGWREFTLAGMMTLLAAAPVAHLSYYEADAYARWKGERLPTEFEWEHAALISAGAPSEELPMNDPGCLHPAVATGTGLTQMTDTLWQWTQSSYAPYPGYRPDPGAVGEYNGKFMVNQYVLRGGSCSTPKHHVRPSYRNFFPATARWQFSGIRLARDKTPW